MSLGEEESGSFFGPLTGKTTTFLLDERDANLAFARTISGLLARTRTPFVVLDLDALYSSNADRILAPLDAATARSTVIRIPEPGSEVELEVSRLFEAQQKVVVVDSLNSLYHTVSLEDGSARNRKLDFVLASLSYLARANEKAVILSMYRRRGLYRAGTGTPISSLTDATASVSKRGGILEMRGERGPSWPGGVFSIRIP